MGNVLAYRPRTSPPELIAEKAGFVEIQFADALDCYENWASPTVIISDGPYGLSKYPGDPPSTESLVALYAPHVAAWSKYSLPETTLWFWCSELGWAETHDLLKMHGWKYKTAHIWDKGIGHVAGNSNGDSIRGFPVVSEICVQYVREARLKDVNGEEVSLKLWLRREWQRSGLPLSKTNEACGVKNAATRKYFTQCHLWYFPPADKMIALAKYVAEKGKKTSRPYFSLDGKTPLSEGQWERLRAKWNHSYSVTNVWSEPAVRGSERVKADGLKAFHANQKPLKLMKRIVEASSDKGDIVWEPFGGLCSGAIAAFQTGRSAYAAEVVPEFFEAASDRIGQLQPKSYSKLNDKYVTASA